MVERHGDEMEDRVIILPGRLALRVLEAFDEVPEDPQVALDGRDEALDPTFSRHRRAPDHW